MHVRVCKTRTSLFSNRSPVAAAGRSPLCCAYLKPLPQHTAICRVSSDDGPQSESTEESAKLELSDPLTRSMSEIARTNGRPGNSTNLVLAGDESKETWLKLDKKVNTYPYPRDFKAIGRVCPDFQDRMVSAVIRVVPVHEECVSSRPSSKGSYVSVTIGPVWVENPDQVIEIYAQMKEEGGADLRYLI